MHDDEQESNNSHSGNDSQRSQTEKSIMPMMMNFRKKRESPGKGKRPQQ